MYITRRKSVMIKNSEKLEIHKDSLTINGKPFYLASGDMHYFRYFKGGGSADFSL